MSEATFEFIDFEPEWQKICKEHPKKKDRYNVLEKLLDSRFQTWKAELLSGLRREK